MKEITTPLGFRDLYDKEADKFTYFANCMFNISKKYGCREINTSIVEKISLFQNNMENSSVVVDKEIFMLEKEGLCLRPEITAPVVRFLTEKNQLKSRLMYYGPCFRGERPQLGRYRQFWQFGVEMTGGTILDIYDCFNIIIDGLKLLNKKFTIYINHMGDANTRQIYEKELSSYFQNKNLSDISKLRLKENRLLRILDSKEEIDKPIIENAPKLYDYLSDENKNILNNICAFIAGKDIEAKINHNLVRGLDYYSGIVFEIMDESNGLAICGGGEYNNLLSLNNININCIGFAFGVDRTCQYINLPSKPTLLLVGNNIESIDKTAQDIRSKNIYAVTYMIDFSTNQYKKLDSIGAQYGCDYTIILYEYDVRINGNNFNKNISYQQFMNNNYEILDDII